MNIARFFDNIEVFFYLEDANVYRPILKNATMFFLKKTCSSFISDLSCLLFVDECQWKKSLINNVNNKPMLQITLLA